MFLRWLSGVACPTLWVLEGGGSYALLWCLYWAAVAGAWCAWMQAPASYFRGILDGCAPTTASDL